MPKKKKTLKQKIVADKRREISAMYTYTASEKSIKQEPEEKMTTQIKHPMTTAISYDYLGTDLRKTALFTGAIVLVELILKIFLR